MENEQTNAGLSGSAAMDLTEAEAVFAEEIGVAGDSAGDKFSGDGFGTDTDGAVKTVGAAGTDKTGGTVGTDTLKTGGAVGAFGTVDLGTDETVTAGGDPAASEFPAAGGIPTGDSVGDASALRAELDALKEKHRTLCRRFGIPTDETEGGEAEADVIEIRRAFPDLREAHVAEFANREKYERLRGSGLSPADAYFASHAETLMREAESRGRQAALDDTRSHLRSAVPVGCLDASVPIPQGEMQEWRDLFPHLDDRSIAALYRNTL